MKRSVMIACIEGRASLDDAQRMAAYINKYCDDHVVPQAAADNMRVVARQLLRLEPVDERLMRGNTPLYECLVQLETAADVA